MLRSASQAAGLLVFAGMLALCAGPARSEPASDVTDVESAAPDEPESDASRPEGYTIPPEVEAILNQSSDQDAYVETERCIQTRDIRDTEILDQKHLVFELYGQRFYLVQFPRVCQGLRRGATIIYETRTGQLCRLDQIRAYDPGLGPPNPPCSLPGFMPVAKEQVALLKDSLKAQRKAERDAYKAEKEKEKKPPPENAEPETDG